MSFRFLHASDLHLDTPFSGLRSSDDGVGARVALATTRSLQNLCDVAIEREVDFVVLAGDIYDGPRRGLHGEHVLRTELARLGREGITVYLAQGNHDPIEDGYHLQSRVPDNVSVFPPKVAATYKLRSSDGTAVHIVGVSFGVRHELEDLTPLFPLRDESAFTVGVLHCSVGTNSEHERYAPTSLDRLIALNYDYWALGHIHRRTTLREALPPIIYSGNTQGLSLKPSERGPKGVTIVTVDGDMVTAEFAPTGDVCFDLISIRISSYEDIEQVVEESLLAVREYELPPMATFAVLRVALEIPCPAHRRRSFAAELRSELNALLAPLDDRYIDSVELTTPRVARSEGLAETLEGFLQTVSPEDLRPLLAETLDSLRLPSVLADVAESLDEPGLALLHAQAHDLVVSLISGEQPSEAKEEGVEQW